MAHATSRPRASTTVLPVARTSTVDLIAEELRSAIYAGVLPVGSALREVDIASQLGVSRSPFREAAQRLVQEGLLTNFPGRGLRVTHITGDEVIDVYRARLAIESEAVSVICDAHATLHQRHLIEITRSFDLLVAASSGDDPWSIGDADLTFHQTLVDQAQSKRLSRHMSTLVIETRIISLSAQDGYSVRKSVSPTYNTLISALTARDTHRAIAALSQQFSDAIDRLLGRDTSVATVETETEESHTQLQPIDADRSIT